MKARGEKNEGEYMTPLSLVDRRLTALGEAADLVAESAVLL